MKNREKWRSRRRQTLCKCEEAKSTFVCLKFLRKNLLRIRTTIHQADRLTVIGEELSVSGPIHLRCLSRHEKFAHARRNAWRSFRLDENRCKVTVSLVSSMHNHKRCSFNSYSQDWITRRSAFSKNGNGFRLFRTKDDDDEQQQTLER